MLNDSFCCVLWPKGKIETVFEVGSTRHEFTVIKRWEQDPALFLNDVALLPFAPLTAAKAPKELLGQIALQVHKIESEQQRKEISAYTQLMAGLRFKKSLIDQIFQEGMMRESVVYQDILQKSRQEGRQEEGRAFVLRLIKHRFGTISSDTQDQISTLSIAQLEDLGEFLLDFTEMNDLQNWLISKT